MTLQKSMRSVWATLFALKPGLETKDLQHTVFPMHIMICGQDRTNIMDNG